MTDQIVTQKSFNASLGRPIQILLVEDSPSDVAMTVGAFGAGRIANCVHVVGDGENAMAFLRHEAQYADAPRPDLVILDLNLPRKDGREVLADIKTDDDLKIIPVVVLTTSSADADVRNSYELHVNSYVTKPLSFDDFLEAVRNIEDFWLSLVRFPSRAQP